MYNDGGGGPLRRLERDDVVRRATGIIKDWLDANLRHVYGEKQQEFTGACLDCAEAVHAPYDAVLVEARSIEVLPGFHPEGTPDPAPRAEVPRCELPTPSPPLRPAFDPAPAAPTAPAEALARTARRTSRLDPVVGTRPPVRWPPHPRLPPRR
ncbi:hypothetical protein [Rhodococcus sp. JS3073]|uniref:hypothetical protein n=1 Tax=Rhodococcus sp. JS3073 TaxID=3002901 RepID=UPI0022867AD3|nr:hypothetical protein [Rhodococcus sp. JS3073]WAM16110.1 hypothetical protein OYT95_05650 [Rhodococcus sp. JS3073]